MAPTIGHSAHINSYFSRRYKMNQQLTHLARLDPTTLNRALIGFDRFFNDVDHKAHAVHTSYPPYNILKTSENNYVIEVAVTGFSKEEISVDINQAQLIVSTRCLTAYAEDTEYLYRGLATREFERTFTLADYMEVTSACVSNGLLKICISRVLPDALKPRSINITTA